MSERISDLSFFKGRDVVLKVRKRRTIVVDDKSIHLVHFTDESLSDLDFPFDLCNKTVQRSKGKYGKFISKLRPSNI